MKEEDFSAGKAEELGVYLGIQPGRIYTLKKDSGGDSDILLSKVITEWLNNDSGKSWQKLATALKQCGYSLMAEKIAPQEGKHEFHIIDSVRYNTPFIPHHTAVLIIIGSPINE